MMRRFGSSPKPWSRLLVHLADGAVARPQPVADAVVAREVGGCLRGRDQVVAGEAELHGARELALPHLSAELAAQLDRPVDRLRHARLDPLRLVQLLRDADTQAAQVL